MFVFLFPLPTSQFCTHICKEGLLALKLSSSKLAKLLVGTKAVAHFHFQSSLVYFKSKHQFKLDSTFNLTILSMVQDKPYAILDS